MSTYYVAGDIKEDGANSYSCIFIDSSGYTFDSENQVFLGKNFGDESTTEGFVFISHQKTALGIGKGTLGSLDSTLNIQWGFYTDGSEVYIVKNGTAIPSNQWGGLGSITGSGTAGRLVKWVSESEIGDSNLEESDVPNKNTNEVINGHWVLNNVKYLGLEEWGWFDAQTNGEFYWYGTTYLGSDVEIKGRIDLKDSSDNVTIIIDPDSNGGDVTIGNDLTSNTVHANEFIENGQSLVDKYAGYTYTHNMFKWTTPNWLLEGGTLTDEGGLNISWTSGTYFDMSSGTNKTFSSGSTTLTDDKTNYIYVNNSTGSVEVSTTFPDFQHILLGIVSCLDGDIYRIFQEENVGFSINDQFKGLEDLFPEFVKQGLIVEPHPSTALAVKTDGGVYYENMRKKTTVPTIDSTVTPIRMWYHDSNGNWISTTSTTLDVTHYDTGTGLAEIPNNKYVKGLFFVSPTEIHYVYPNSYYNTLSSAITSEVPAVPEGLVRLPRSMALVFQEGITELPDITSENWIDLRRTFDVQYTKSPIYTHGDLAGLTNDDHPQYANIYDSETITGSWNFANDMNFEIYGGESGYESYRLKFRNGYLRIYGDYLDYTNALIFKAIDSNNYGDFRFISEKTDIPDERLACRYDGDNNTWNFYGKIWTNDSITTTNCISLNNDTYDQIRITGGSNGYDDIRIGRKGVEARAFYVYNGTDNMFLFNIYDDGRANFYNTVTFDNNISVGAGDITAYIDLGSNARLMSKNSSYLHVRNLDDTDYIGVACKRLWVTSYNHELSTPNAILVVSTENSEVRYRTPSEIAQDIGVPQYILIGWSPLQFTRYDEYIGTTSTTYVGIGLYERITIPSEATHCKIVYDINSSSTLRTAWFKLYNYDYGADVSGSEVSVSDAYFTEVSTDYLPATYFFSGDRYRIYSKMSYGDSTSRLKGCYILWYKKVY